MLLSKAEADTPPSSRSWYLDAAAVGGVAVCVVALAAALVTWAGRSAVLRWAIRSGLALGLAGSLQDFERRLDATPRVMLVLGAVALAHAVTGRLAGCTVPADDRPAVFPRPARPGPRELAAITVVMVGALSLRLFDLSRDFGSDEFFTVIHFVGVTATWDTVSRYFYFNNHIGYSLLARWTYLLVGGAEWAIRLPAMAFGLASVAATWWFGRRWLGVPAALAAAALLALMPSHVLYSRSARGYSGLALFGVLSTHLYLRYRAGDPPRTWAFIAAHVAGIYVHLYLAAVTIVQALDYATATVVSLVSRRPAFPPQTWRRLWWAFPAILVLSALTYAPVAGELLRNVGGVAKTPVQWGFPLVLRDELFAVLPAWQSYALLTLTAAGTVVLAVRRPWLGLHLTAVAAVPFLVMWIVLRPATLFPRFLLYMAPIVAWLLASGIVAAWQAVQRPVVAAWAIRAAVLTVLALPVWTWIGAGLTRESTPEYRAAVARMTQPPADDLTLCAFGGDAHGIQYFTTRPIVVVRTPGQLDGIVGSTRPFRCLYLYVAWNSEEQQQMAAGLAQHARVTAFRDLTLFERPGR